MKRKTTLRLISFLLLTMIVAVFLSACGAENGDYVDSKEVGAVSDSFGSKTAEENSSSNSDDSKADIEQRKIIETIYYSVETKNFDELVTTLETQALKVGGYIEQSDVSGNSYEYEISRYASFTFRIPSEKVEEFTNIVSENSTVTDRTVTTEDVTLDYVDAQSRIKALKTEQEALEALLANAKSTAEILEIRDMLTDVIYEIESYESQLRTYDNLVDYTKITVDISEVEQTTIVHKQSTWERIGTNLAENTLGLWNFLVEIFVFFVSALPILLFLGLIVLIVFLIIKLAVRKSSKKKKIAPVVPKVNPQIPPVNQQPVNNNTVVPPVEKHDK